MDAAQKKMKDARAEIEAVLKKHDIAGFVTLHAGGSWGEVFWNMWPSWSIVVGDFPAIRLKSKAADYPSLIEQRHAQEQTAQMLNHLAMSMGACSVQFLELSQVVDGVLEATHVDKGFTPDPSKSNPGVH